MSTPERLALRREPDKSFVVVGTVVADTKTEVTVATRGETVEVMPRKGLVFVSLGSLNYFARVDVDALRRAFDNVPQAVFEQALLDATSPLSGADLKKKLTQAGLATAAVDRSWDDARKALEANPDVRVVGAGASRRFVWTGSDEVRLRDYVTAVRVERPPADAAPDHDAEGVSAARRQEAASAPAQVEPGVDLHRSGQPIAPVRDAAPPDASDQDPAPDDLFLAVLDKFMGEAAPLTLDEVRESVLRIGAALSSAPISELKSLVDVPEAQRSAASLVLMARDREVQLWSGESARLPSPAAAAAVESAIAEASRSVEQSESLARLLHRVIARTNVDELPLSVVASAFVRSAGAETGSEPSRAFLGLAGALADRVRTSVAQDWAGADRIVADAARGMNRLALDADGPRTRFLAALYEVRRGHLDGDLFWKNVDLGALDDAAGGALRRALLDPRLADRVVKPEVARFVGDCRTRHDLGRLVSLRGSFARYLDARTVTATMARVAKEDAKAQEWFQHLRQEARLEVALKERDAAVQSAVEAESRAAEAEVRTARAVTDRDAAADALKRVGQASAQASEAQLRQARLDVLRTLATVAATVRVSGAAKEDPALLQRLGFALRREGLVEIAEPGETVLYDPALHDAQGEHIDPGTAVSVGRSGYTYDSGEDSLVLVKALVSAS